MLVREGGLGTSSTAGERMRLDPSAYQTGSESLIHGGVRAARDTATSGAAYCTRGVVAVAASTVVVVVVTVTLLVVLLHPATKHICPPNSYRLPTTVLPESYSISWNPLFSAPFTFSGSTNVSVRAQSAVGCVVLHAEGLDFVEGVWLYFGVTGEDGSLDPAATATAKQLVKLSSLLRYEDEQMIGIPLTTKIAEGERIVLAFKFKSTLGQDMTGLYVSSYNETDSKGATKLKYMVSSQFESTYARHAFPCFDEPAMKANFTVAVQNVNTGQVCLSNMPESAASLRDARGAVGFPRTCTFDTSIRMSTYLVTVVIGELYSVQGVTSSGTQVRVWATKNDAGNLDFALGVVLDVLPYFERLFDVPFPIPKLDYAAIPDFAAGAMEGFGLVTSRSTALIANVNTSSSAELLRVAVVVSHELSHQWTGNLVTAEWWGSLFLNEGCATLFEYYGTEASHPELGVWDTWYSDVPRPAMLTSAYAAAHPLVNPNVDSAQSIEEMFDDISYQFGGATLRMVAETIGRLRGTAAFTSAMRTYLQEHAFSVASAEDLWSSMAEGANLPVLRSGLSAWSHVTGFPLLSFAWADGDNSNPARSSGALRVSQTRLFRSPYSQEVAAAGGGASKLDADPVWWVPLTFAVQYDGNGGDAAAAAAEAWAGTGFDTRAWTRTFAYDLAADGFLKANVNQTGLWRATYPPAVWSALKGAVQEQLVAIAPYNGSYAFSQEDRAGLLDDLMVVILNGYAGTTGLTIDTALDYLSVLQFELAQTVWDVAISHLNSLYSLLTLAATSEPTPGHAIPAACPQDLARYARSLLRPAVTAVGWGAHPVYNTSQPAQLDGDDDPTVALLRSVLLRAAVTFGDNATITTAQALWATVTATPDLAINPDLLSTVTRAVVAHGGTQAWNQVRDLYETTADPGAKTTYLYALAATPSTALLQQTLAYAISASVRSQDTVSLVANVAANPAGSLLAWNFFKANFALFDKRYGSGGFDASDIVDSTASPHVTAALFDDVTNFFNHNSFPAADLTIQRSLESIQAHQIFISGHRSSPALAQPACQWLATNA